MTLASVTRGKQVRPFYVLLFGTEGVGKSSWAADAPDPIFIPTEEGTDHLDVARFPLCRTWTDINECVDELHAGGHGYKTVVIDTADQAECLAWDHLFATKKTEKGAVAESIGDYGFGKGYEMALDLWRVLVSKLERLRSEQGMNVVILAHTHVKNFSNPEGENFDRYELKMNQKLAGFLKSRPYAVLFATYEIYSHIKNGEKKAKGVGSGARILRTERRPAFDAKNRYGLPYEMPLSFEDFYAYAQNGAIEDQASPSDLAAKITAQAAGTRFEQRVAKGIADANGTDEKLRAIQNWLTAKLNEGNE